jgi:hypothetical protein
MILLLILFLPPTGLGKVVSFNYRIYFVQSQFFGFLLIFLNFLFFGHQRCMYLIKAHVHKKRSAGILHDQVCSFITQTVCQIFVACLGFYSRDTPWRKIVIGIRWMTGMATADVDIKSVSYPASNLLFRDAIFLNARSNIRFH